MTACERCDARQRPGARFCHACGEPLSAEQIASSIAPDDPRPGYGLAIAWSILSCLTWLGSGVVGILMLDAGNHWSSREKEAFAAVFFMTLLVAVPAGIVYSIWLYRAWSAVPVSCRSAAPRQAVVLLFVPFYNFYWLFRAHVGLSNSIEAAQHKYDVNPRGAGGALAILMCLVMLIPFVKTSPHGRWRCSGCST